MAAGHLGVQGCFEHAQMRLVGVAGRWVQRFFENSHLCPARTFQMCVSICQWLLRPSTNYICSRYSYYSELNLITCETTFNRIKTFKTLTALLSKR